MKTLGQKLYELRKRQDKTQAQVAAEVKMTAAMISDFEKDKGDPSLSTLNRLAAYYEVSLTNLLDSSSVIEDQSLSALKVQAAKLIFDAELGKVRAILTILRGAEVSTGKAAKPAAR